jgi:hypothetical protein
VAKLFIVVLLFSLGIISADAQLFGNGHMMAIPTRIPVTPKANPTSISFTPSSGVLVDNAGSGVQVGTFQVNMSDSSTNYPGTPTISNCVHPSGTCPLVVGTKTGTTWRINTSRVLTSADDGSTAVNSIQVSAP